MQINPKVVRAPNGHKSAHFLGAFSLEQQGFVSGCIPIAHLPPPCDNGWTAM